MAMDDKALQRSGPVLVSCAALVVIVAGLRAAQPIVVPLVVATFAAMICLPVLRWLQEKRLPTWLALIVMTTGIILIGLAIIAIVGTSINQLREDLPEYQTRIGDLQQQLTDRLKPYGIDLGAGFRKETFDAQRAVSLFGDMLGALGAVLSDGLVIGFTLIFMLLEAAELPKKLRAIGGGTDAVAARFDGIQQSVRRYISIKTRICFVNGVLVTLWVWWLGVDFPLLWGLLAFLFNYIPNIGSFIAAIPAIVLALVQHGWASAAYVAAGYIVIDMVIGSIIEPRIMGRGLGLSPLVVFVSLVFWGWVLGPVGMLFSVPLTMLVKIVLDHSEDLRWIGVLLSAEAPDARDRPRGEPPLNRGDAFFLWRSSASPYRPRRISFLFVRCQGLRKKNCEVWRARYDTTTIGGVERTAPRLEQCSIGTRNDAGRTNHCLRTGVSADGGTDQSADRGLCAAAECRLHRAAPADRRPADVRKVSTLRFPGNLRADHLSRLGRDRQRPLPRPVCQRAGRVGRRLAGQQAHFGV